MMGPFRVQEEVTPDLVGDAHLTLGNEFCHVLQSILQIVNERVSV